MVNGEQTGEPFIDIKFLECLENNCPCNYVPMDANCLTPLTTTSGNTIGIGIDLGKQNRTKLSNFQVRESILSKFDGLYGLQGESAVTKGKEIRANLTEMELEEFNRVYIGSTVNAL